jgi:hypothetical protein
MSEIHSFTIVVGQPKKSWQKTRNVLTGFLQLDEFSEMPDLSRIETLNELSVTIYGPKHGIDFSVIDCRLTILTIRACDMVQLPDLSRFPNLRKLNVCSCKLVELPNLPSRLQSLICSNNRLSELPALPDTLTHIDCSWNMLTTLPRLSPSLRELICNDNYLKRLPVYNANLSYINCANNILRTIEPLDFVGYGHIGDATIYFPNNPIYTFICDDMGFGEAYYQTKIYVLGVMYRFKRAYSRCRLYGIMRKWLYEKYLEPRMMAKYHPDILWKMLVEIGDDAEDEDAFQDALDAW